MAGTKTGRLWSIDSISSVLFSSGIRRVAGFLFVSRHSREDLTLYRLFEIPKRHVCSLPQEAKILEAESFLSAT